MRVQILRPHVVLVRQPVRVARLHIRATATANNPGCPLKASAGPPHCSPGTTTLRLTGPPTCVITGVVLNSLYCTAPVVAAFVPTAPALPSPLGCATSGPAGSVNNSALASARFAVEIRSHLARPDLRRIRTPASASHQRRRRVALRSFAKSVAS